jgi:hypothetical protein
MGASPDGFGQSSLHDSAGVGHLKTAFLGGRVTQTIQGAGVRLGEHVRYPPGIAQDLDLPVNRWHRHSRGGLRSGRFLDRHCWPGPPQCRFPSQKQQHRQQSCGHAGIFKDHRPKRQPTNAPNGPCAKPARATIELRNSCAGDLAQPPDIGRFIAWHEECPWFLNSRCGARMCAIVPQFDNSSSGNKRRSV